MVIIAVFAAALTASLMSPAGAQVVPETPSIGNIPSVNVVGSGFTASVVTNSDGAASVTSSTPTVCTVSTSDNLTVAYIAVGMCTLTAHTAATLNFDAADGNPQSFTVGQGTPTTPTITNIPASPVFNVGFMASVSTNGDGTKSVTSSTPSVCTVGPDNLTVGFVGVGTCTLTAHVSAGTNYGSADGTAQSFTVGQGTPTTPTITNIPASPTFGSQFVASVSTNGDGALSVTSSTPSVCTVGHGGLTVTFAGVGFCTLTAQVSAGVDYLAGIGNPQSFVSGLAVPTTPSISNLPSNPLAEGGFTASVSTNGDGQRSVVSGTPGVCTVGGDGVTVAYVAAGSCTLTAQVALGHSYFGAVGSPQTFTIRPVPHGYWLVGSDGGIFTFGNSQFWGSTGNLHLQRPVVGITPTDSRNGYWLVASDGGIFSFGDAGFYGSIPGVGLHPAGSGAAPSLNAPIVATVPSTTGHGYFMVASDGGVFAFGDAHFAGSCPGIGGCAGAAVAVVPDATGRGYWLFTNTGNVYTFGDAPYYGSLPATGVAVTSAVATPDGHGYWILFANGAVASFGDAPGLGSPIGYTNSSNPATTIFATANGGGYWVGSARGDVFAYGDAPFLGSMAATVLNGLIVGASGY